MRKSESAKSEEQQKRKSREKFYNDPERQKSTNAATEFQDVGHGGVLVESIAFNRRVVGSNPALAAM